MPPPPDRRRAEVYLHPFLTSALDRGGWPTQRRRRLTPCKEPRYPLYRRLGGPPGRSGRMWRENIFPPPCFEARTVQPQWLALPTTLSRTPIPNTVCLRLHTSVNTWAIKCSSETGHGKTDTSDEKNRRNEKGKTSRRTYKVTEWNKH
jgi:hypothetical protein